MDVYITAVRVARSRRRVYKTATLKISDQISSPMLLENEKNDTYVLHTCTYGIVAYGLLVT